MRGPFQFPLSLDQIGRKRLFGQLRFVSASREMLFEMQQVLGQSSRELLQFSILLAFRQQGKAE
jgi:hypothetical protein